MKIENFSMEESTHNTDKLEFVEVDLKNVDCGKGPNIIGIARV